MTSQASLFGPTFSEAKSEFWEILHRGDSSLCPCCGRFAKIYKRRLNAAQAHDLLLMYRIFRDDPGLGWIAWRDLFKNRGGQSNEFAKLRFWDLIEPKPKDDEPSRSSGYWRLTPKGERFARGAIRVPSHCYIFDDRRRGFSEESCDIREALGELWNYDELMKDQAIPARVVRLTP